MPEPAPRRKLRIFAGSARESQHCTGNLEYFKVLPERASTVLGTSNIFRFCQREPAPRWELRIFSGFVRESQHCAGNLEYFKIIKEKSFEGNDGML